MSHNHRFLVVAVLLLASACTNSATESRSDGATPGTGGTGGITSTPVNSGGSSATSVSSSGGGSSDASATTGGASASSGGSSGQTGGTGGTSQTGGTTASIPTTSIDASIEYDVGPDGPVLAQCLNDGGYPVFMVCTDDTSSSVDIPHYVGRVIAVESSAPDAGAESVPCGRFTATIGSPQRFTLALQDGGTVEIVYGSGSAIILPSLSAWMGKTVTVDVKPYGNGGYFANGSLLVSDSKGLVFDGVYHMGGNLTSQAVGTTGITVSAGPAACLGFCRHLQREIVFDHDRLLVAANPGQLQRWLARFHGIVAGMFRTPEGQQLRRWRVLELMGHLAGCPITVSA
jgi:hypothetical protein